MDILTHVNWVDVLVLIIVLRTSYVSLKDGLSRELFPLLGSIFMVVVSLGYYGRMGYFLNHNMTSVPIDMANFIAFVTLVVASGVILKLLKYAVDFMIKVEWNPALERTGGAVCGILRSFVAASLVLMILSMMPMPYFQRSIRDGSLTGRYILAVGPYVYEKAVKLMPALDIGYDAANQGEVLKKLQSDKSANLNVPDGKSRLAVLEKVKQ